jgi:hypothetical protein
MGLSPNETFAYFSMSLIACARIPSSQLAFKWFLHIRLATFAHLLAVMVNKKESNFKHQFLSNTSL